MKEASDDAVIGNGRIGIDDCDFRVDFHCGRDDWSM